MKTLTQFEESSTTITGRSTRIRPDIWELVREAAFKSKISMVDEIDSILRRHYGVPPLDEQPVEEV